MAKKQWKVEAIWDFQCSVELLSDEEGNPWYRVVLPKSLDIDGESFSLFVSKSGFVRVAKSDTAHQRAIRR